MATEQIKIKRAALLLLVTLFTTYASAICETMTVPLSDPNKKMIDLVTTIYTERELERIDALEDITINELNELYPIQRLRKMDDNSYSTMYRSEDKLLIISFDENGRKRNAALNLWSFSRESKDFDQIKIGQYWEVVRKFDSNGIYILLGMNMNNPSLPSVSVHYGIDGYSVLITYDENYCVESVEKAIY